MASNSGNELVEYDIILKAQGAVKELATLNSLVGTFDSKIVKVSQTIDTAAKNWKKNWRDVLVTFQMLDRQAGAFGQKTLFGSEGGKGWTMTKNFMEAAEAGGRLKSVVTDMPPKVSAAGASIEKADKQTKGFGYSMANLGRIIEGTLVAMTLFRIIQFVQDTLRKATEEAGKFERALYNLKVAETSLSESGIEVSMESFKTLMTEIKELFPYISKIDITKMVSSLAVLTKDLGLTTSQFSELAKTIPILSAQSGDSIESVTEQVVNGLANSGRGWKDLGIVVDAAIIKQKAVESGLVENVQAYDALTAEQKQHVEVLSLISILNDSASISMEKQGEFLETNIGQIQQSSAEWEDFLVILGQFTLGLKSLFAPALVDILKFLEDATNGFKAFMIVVFAAQKQLLLFAYTVAQIAKNPLKLLNLNDVAGVFSDAWQSSLEDGFNKFFEGEVPDNAPDWFKKLFSGFEKQQDTPTNLTALQDSLESIDTSKAQTEIQDLLKDLDDLDRKEEKLRSDFATKQQRETEDHLINMARDEKDYQTKRARTIEDFNNDIREKNKKYREKELNDEAKFQEQLRQLRERFLFDLEDALRDRDARQVLRLQEKYRMDKQALINEHLLKKKDDAQQHADEMAQAQQDLAEKLRRMDEDHAIEMARKEEDFKEKQQRELEDHQRELEELQAMRQAKIQETAQAIAEEFGLKEGGVQALYELLNQYYGPGGAFDGLYDYTNGAMLSSAEQMLAQLQGIIAQYRGMVGAATMGMAGGVMPVSPTMMSGGAFGMSKVPARSQQPSLMRSQAEGGTYLATRATRTTFGEAGPELAQFIPLGRSLPVNNGGMGGFGASGGQIDIQLALSPDLEARIVNNTLDRAANVVLSVVESK